MASKSKSRGASTSRRSELRRIYEALLERGQDGRIYIAEAQSFGKRDQAIFNRVHEILSTGIEFSAA